MIKKIFIILFVISLTTNSFSAGSKPTDVSQIKDLIILKL